jgi:hypothetical protein
VKTQQIIEVGAERHGGYDLDRGRRPPRVQGCCRCVVGQRRMEDIEGTSATSAEDA